MEANWSNGEQCRKVAATSRRPHVATSSSPCRGNLLFQVQGAHGETAHPRDRFRRKPGCGFGFVMYTCIRTL